MSPIYMGNTQVSVRALGCQNLTNVFILGSIVGRKNSTKMRSNSTFNLIFCLQKKVSNLLPLLHHLACPITLAYLAAIVYQMEKITLACVRKVEGDHTASVSPNTILLLSSFIALSL